MIPNKLPLPPIPAPSRQKLELLMQNGEDGQELVLRLIEQHKLPYMVENGRLKDTLSRGELHLKEFITIEDETLRMKEDARKIAKSEHEVLITGETGTGKELIAKSMIGERVGAIKAVNCAGFPSELIESELFGHIRGSFTGANTEKEGLLSAAKDGIMFLDEVGELPMHVQAKLLRALQDKSIRKVGSNVEEKITCKFVCATHRNLKKMVEAKEFRQDLYARISTLELHIKPLRDRKVDIVPITESLKGGKDFLLKHQDELPLLDLSLNVRSLQQHVIRFAVLGRLVK